MHRSGFSFWLAASGALLFCTGLTLFLNEPARIDREVLAWMGDWRSPFLDRVMVAVTHLGGPPAILLLTLAVTVPLLVMKKVRESLYFLVSVLGAALFSSLMKEAFERGRPAEALLETASYAFPSWHSAVSSAAAVSLLFLFLRAVPVKYRPIAVFSISIWPLFIGMTRIYLHLHWFSDVLAGWGLGLFWASLAATVLTGKGRADGRV